MEFLELALITGDYQLARQAEAAGIDRIFVDLERLGKQERQAGEGLFLSQHRPEDVNKIAAVLNKCRLMVRINPFHSNTPQEVEQVLEDGAEIIMLPMFENALEVRDFVSLVGGRATTSLLLENKTALENIEEIVQIAGIDEIHVGLNDLRLSLGLNVIFEVLCNGILDHLSEVIRAADIGFGFGGVSSPNARDLPVQPERIIAEQVRLNSSMALLGRSFRQPFEDLTAPEKLAQEIQAIRQCVSRWQQNGETDFRRNQRLLAQEVESWRHQMISKT
ncbi:MAG: aldolase/citrate lyase family protein [Crocosphaera sp.]